MHILAQALNTSKASKYKLCCTSLLIHRQGTHCSIAAFVVIVVAGDSPSATEHWQRVFGFLTANGGATSLLQHFGYQVPQLKMVRAHGKQEELQLKAAQFIALSESVHVWKVTHNSFGNVSCKLSIII